MIKVYFKYIGKCHNKTHYFVQLIHTNKNGNIAIETEHCGRKNASQILRQNLIPEKHKSK